jgi:Mitochondrial K+-H+ exchange-related
VPFTIIPGPNIPAIYFSFRALAHFFSMRGASRGLSGVAWEPLATPHLSSLRGALTLDASARAARLDEIGAALGLERLAPFVKRVAARPS